MRILTTGLAALALGACVMPMPMGGGAGIATNPEEARAASAALEASQASQASAAAQASRPGDADMTCPAIQAELMASMQDPKFQAAMASMGSRAQGQKDKIDAATASGKASKPTAEDARAPLDTTADLTSIMPQIMRGQRLNELATAKKCAFLSGKPQ